MTDSIHHLISAPFSRPARSLCALALAALLAACASPGPEHPPLALASAEALGLDAMPAATMVDAHWWQALGDPQLDALVERGLQTHPSLAVVQARVAHALALADISRASAGPQASLSLSATRQRYSENGLVPPPIAGNVWNSGNLQAGLSWEPDFFGRHQAELAAAVGQARASAADAAAARNLLASQISRAYLNLARLFEQRELAQRGLAQHDDMLALTLQRVRAGLDTAVEQTQSEAGLPDARLQIEQLDEQIALGRNQLAALTLAMPAETARLQPHLQALRPLTPPAVLGADLLGRRPDVVAARWRVEAAGQDVASARTQFYPNISLSAFVGFDALGLNQLLDLGSRQFGAGPALHLPLFDGGRLRAQLGGRQADLDAAIAVYNGTLVDALREARDALATLQSLQRQQQQQQLAQANAEQALALAEQRSRAGLGNALLPLASEGPLLAQLRVAADLRARTLDTQLQLMRAVGGGWVDDNPGPGNSASR